MSDGGMSDGGGLLILGAVVASGVGALCVLFAVLLGIELNVVTSAVLALAVGVTMTFFSNAGNFVVSGMIASAITLLTLLVGRALLVSEYRGGVIDECCSDEACIRAMAETAMWRAAMAADPGEGCGDLEFGVPGAELLAPNPEIPDAILRRASRNWAALPECKKENMRRTRKKLMERAHGKRLDQYGTQPGWGHLFAMGCLSVSIVFFVGASATIRGGR